MKKKWYQSAYRRNVVDMHITDWDEKFLSEFDPKEYVKMLVLSQVQSAVVYAHSEVGHCNYPTKIGHMHRGLKGKNILGEVIKLCHQNGIIPVVYFSLIFDSWAHHNNPDWRIIGVDGKEATQNRRYAGRYGVCCPNSPYRGYTVAHVQEICNKFDFEGFRFDMTFWPTVCYCAHCKGRFAEEVGGEIPKVINWEDPNWVSFQRKREEWLIDFATLMTSTVKRIKPEVSVEHQASTYPASWQRGVIEKLDMQNDFLQGDFYGGPLQGSFVRKLLGNLAKNGPVGFETSVRMPNVRNHTEIKSEELLKTHAYAALADGGAFIFIDAIDPVGTLDRAVYERMGKVFNETKRYEPYLGGERCQDVAVYLSTESKFDFADNGKRVDDRELSTKMPHVDAALNACKSLIDYHIPFGVISKRNLGKLLLHKILVLPNVLMMDEEEVEAIRNYVGAGGNLYASKYTSLINKVGIRKVDFLLSDLFGLSYLGETKENFTYIAPEEEKSNLFPGHSQKYPLTIDGSQLIVKAKGNVEILAKMVLPYTDPKNTSRYASIHTNPPGINTDYPAVVLNKFGKGKVIYVSGDLENTDLHRDTFINLIKLLSSSFSFEAVAPKSVEITSFHQKEKNRYIISLVNFQKELPDIPVDEIKLRVKLHNRSAKHLTLLPEEKEVHYEMRDDCAEFTIPRLETFLMLALAYE